VSIILLGNKCDSKDRKVTREEGRDMANKFNMQFLETSAKDDINVAEAF